MKRPLWRRAARWLLWTGAVVAVLLLAGALVLETDWARERARRLVERQASEALGREVSIGALDFDLLALSASAESIAVGGPDGLAEPLATVEELSVQIGPGLLGSLVSSDPILLREIVVSRAVLDLVFDEEGRSNLPDLSGDGSDDGEAAVRIGALHVERSLLRLEEQGVPLDLEADDVGAVLRQLEGEVFVAEASSQRVELALPEATDPGTPPLEASLDLRVRIEDGVVTIERSAIDGRYLALGATGTLSAEGVDLSIDGSADAGLLVAMGWAEEASGRVEASLALDAGDDTWRLEGDLRSSHLGFGEIALEGAQASLSMDPDELRVQLARGELFGASLSGSASMPLGVEDPRMSVSAEASGLDIAELLASMEPPPIVGLGGVVSGSVEYDFPVDDPVGGSGQGSVRVESPVAADSDVLALTGEGSLAIAQGQLLLSDSQLEAPGQTVALSGAIELADGSGEIDFDLTTTDPNALIELVPELRESEESEIWEPVEGSGEASGRLSFTSEGFDAEIQSSFAALRLGGLPAVEADASLQVDSGGLQRIEASLHRDPGFLSLTGSVPFENPPDGFETPALRLEAEVDNWSLAAVEPWLPFELPLDGRVDAGLQVSGSLEAPQGALELRVSELVTDDARVEGDLVGSVTFGPDAFEIGPVRYRAGSGELELAGRLDRDSGELALEMFSSPFDLAGPPFDELVVGDLTGWVELTGSVGGTLERPEGRVVLTGTGLAVHGTTLGSDGSSAFELVLEDSALSADGSLLGLADLSGGGTWDESGLDLELSVESSAVSELASLAMEEPLEDLSGSFSGSLDVAFGGERDSALLDLEHLELEHRDKRLTNLEPVLVSWQSTGLSLEQLWLEEEGTGSEIVLVGDLEGSTGKLDMAVQSSIDVGWLGVYFPDLDISGRFEVLAAIRGDLGEPEIDGQARFSDGRLIIEGFPHAVEEIEGLFFIYPDRLVIDSSRASFARGEITADGSASISGDDTGAYEIRIRGTDLDIRYPEDWRIRASGQLTLASTDDGRVLSGLVDVERASYVRDFQLGLNNLLRVMFQRTPDLVEETEEVLRQTSLNIAVRGDDALQIQTNIAQFSGDMDFTLRGTLAAPVILGDIRLDRGGHLEFAGAEYTLERGNLSFTNPFRNDPAVDLVASTSVREYDVRLNVFGPVGALETTFSSTPPLPSLDIVSLLTTRSTDSLGSFGSRSNVEEETAGTAETFLASQAASLAGQRVGSLFGLDQVQITPLTGGSSELSAARITVGKRISRDVYVTYSNDPSMSDEQIVEVAWQMYPSIVVMLRATDKSSYTLDIRWSKSF